MSGIFPVKGDIQYAIYVILLTSTEYGVVLESLELDLTFLGGNHLGHRRGIAAGSEVRRMLQAVDEHAMHHIHLPPDLPHVIVIWNENFGQEQPSQGTFIGAVAGKSNGFLVCSCGGSG